MEMSLLNLRHCLVAYCNSWNCTLSGVWIVEKILTFWCFPARYAAMCNVCHRQRMHYWFVSHYSLTILFPCGTSTVPILVFLNLFPWDMEKLESEQCTGMDCRSKKCSHQFRAVGSAEPCEWYGSRCQNLANIAFHFMTLGMACSFIIFTCLCKTCGDWLWQQQANWNFPTHDQMLSCTSWWSIVSAFIWLWLLSRVLDFVINRFSATT